MKQWSKDIEINAPIDKVWELFDGSLEDMQKVMPNVIENTPIKETESRVGSIHRQKYREGKRVQEYEVEIIEYQDEPVDKELKIGFTIPRFAVITARYELKKLNEDTTYFRYTSTNKPLKLLLKMLMPLVGDKVVVKFVDRVKRKAEEGEA